MARASKVQSSSGRRARRHRNQRAPRLERLWPLLFVGLVVAVAASGLRIVDAAHEMRGLYARLGEVQRETDGLLERHSRLLLERGALTSMQNIEEVAETELDMQFPERLGQVLE